MGGVVCNILRRALVTDAASDAQWRSLLGTAEVAQSIANDTGVADKVCKILAQANFSDADKKFFEATLESLWAGYS